ncbi:MAG TPA: uracil-DNA glycosylase [Candidatus Limnocylindrales bacterium]|jgi:DNA polymerase
MGSTVSMTPEERRRALEQIAAEVSVCTRCPLSQGRTLAVPGEGSPETEVVFVGEGPGYNEDQQGRPFVGAAGTLLNDLLRQIGWKRQDVFITNVVKCRPPGNRDPEPNEIAACTPFLHRQLEVLDPAVVVTLGRHSLGYFNPGARISAEHGTVRPTNPDTGAANAVTYAMYHPAAALRQGSLKQTMLVDMCGLPEALIEQRRRCAPAPAESLPSLDPVPEEQAVAAPRADPPADPEVVALDVEPELIAVAMAHEPVGDPLAEPVELDENQMSLF